MPKFKQKPLNKIVRNRQRADYEQDAVYEILDAGFLCHVGYIWEGTPIVIPTAYGRDGDTLYLHGAQKNRMLTSLLESGRASLTVTHLDGLVMARSIFHHSMNYRSATIFGAAREVKGKKEKLEALRIVSDHIFPDRWEEARKPNDKELKATLVVAIDIEDAAAKVRTGPPADEEEDYALPIWAGVLPMQLDMLPPQDDPALMPGLEPTDALHIGRAKYLAKLPYQGEEGLG
jgi:hypothetical protein